ncbi:scavenger receptor class B member 1-like [Epargyreus clarus]|uniref:scavenger receptor class B member 1-like n=1 Tax=Epargyreus clarus TaxID=520877 RepID=UPI003C2E56F0
MVVGATKMTIQHVPSKGRISIMKIQNFTVQKRQSVIRVVYGALLVVLSIVCAAINPIEIFTNWYTDMQEGKFIYAMWEKPTYRLFCSVHVFNYTNVPEYLNGTEKILRVEELGPFVFQEFRTNENITIDKERGVMTMRPRIELKFLPEESVSEMKDVMVTAPNIAVLAISTLLADKLGYLANVGAYYSMKAMGSTLFKTTTTEELLWGYYDPIVTIANKLLPGWIDFEKIGIMDRFYAKRTAEAEIELRNVSKRYSVNLWNNVPGIEEQGFRDMNTSTLCNRIKGSFEGLMLPPNMDKDLELPIFRKQACRIYPFRFHEEVKGEHGFNFYRYAMQESAFNKSSPYACKCTHDCLPDGFVDVGNCYYGFPIALSKPHFQDVDPEQQSFFKGMIPNPEKHFSHVDVEPIIGAPLALSINIQVNIAVRSSTGNTITKPLKNKVLPILWLSLHCEEAPPEVISLLRLRIVIAPPLVITVEVLLFFIGMFLGVQGFHRIWKPKYKLIEPKQKPKVRRKSTERRRSSVILNVSDNNAFKDDDDLAKEAVSLLAITEEDPDLPDLLMNEP